MGKMEEGRVRERRGTNMEAGGGGNVSGKRTRIKVSCRYVTVNVVDVNNGQNTTVPLPLRSPVKCSRRGCFLPELPAAAEPNRTR